MLGSAILTQPITKNLSPPLLALLPRVIRLQLRLGAGPLEVYDEVAAVGAGGQVAILFLAVEVVEVVAHDGGGVLPVAEEGLRQLPAEFRSQEPGKRDKSRGYT